MKDNIREVCEDATCATKVSFSQKDLEVFNTFFFNGRYYIEILEGII